MSDVMKYNPKSPDPISVAAYITLYYRVEKQLSADELRPIFNESVDIGKRILAGQTDLGLQKEMDLVEQARTGQTYAKLIPRSPSLSQSITARATSSPVEDRPHGFINDPDITRKLGLYSKKKDIINIESIEIFGEKFGYRPKEKLIFKEKISIPEPLDFKDPSPFRKKWDAE